MVLCSVADVRTRVFTKLSDADIGNIIDAAYDIVLGLTGATDDSNADVNLAIRGKACALTLRKMRTNGELPASKKQGNAQEQNTIDQDIQDYEAEAKSFIQKYTGSSFSIPSGRMGYGTVNNELS